MATRDIPIIMRKTRVFNGHNSVREGTIGHDGVVPVRIRRDRSGSRHGHRSPAGSVACLVGLRVTRYHRRVAIGTTMLTGRAGVGNREAEMMRMNTGMGVPLSRTTLPDKHTGTTS